MGAVSSLVVPDVSMACCSPGSVGDDFEDIVRGIVRTCMDAPPLDPRTTPPGYDVLRPVREYPAHVKGNRSGEAKE
jgi:hypothetical protein